MNSSEEQALLVLRKWETSSAKVKALLKYPGSPSTTLSSALAGTVLLAEEFGWVSIVGDGGGTIFVGFEGAELFTGTGDDLPISSPEFLMGIEEFVDIHHSSGVSIRLYNFKPKEPAHHDPTM
jgi:hypothetical protein